ncbi:hypothetical protein [Methylobacterium sp. 37f]|uniref:hypothetical protein n=1 Tax=Methylobacterium sp. 37f TaxID=2817058 RepID=UPI001FFC3191|nr:hypothetical protein [Methylobacterium sp. 37f]MCK2054774.1 hypothetical protein [Methylobacterium sp. 37f]
MRSEFVRSVSFIAVSLQLAACATPYEVVDPAQGIAVPRILKSIKCEMITFLETNRQQREYFGNFYRAGNPRAYEHPYIDIADDLFAGIYVNLKEVDVKSLTVGFNRISRLGDFKSLTLGAGPSATLTDTFEVKQNFALLQSAKIYRPSYHTSYIKEHRPSAPDFDCYKGLPEGKDLDFRRVAANEYGSDFQRIRISADLTLSSWLQGLTANMAKNYLTSVDNKEILAPGQISYEFSLSYKLGVDGRYELIAQVWNPLSVEPTVSLERTSTFRFIFNTNYAPISVAADGGAVGVTKIPCPATTKFAFGDCDLNQGHGRSTFGRRSRGRIAGSTVSPPSDDRTPFDRKNNPEVFFTLPFGLPLTSLPRR